MTNILSFAQNCLSDIQGVCSTVQSQCTNFLQNQLQPAVESSSSAVFSGIRDGIQWGSRFVKVGTDINVVNTAMKSFGSFITLVQELPIRELQSSLPVFTESNKIFINASKVLQGISTIAKIDDLISGRAAYNDMIGRFPNFLNVSKTISLLASDMIGHLKTAAEIGLVNAKTIAQPLVQIDKVQITLNNLQTGLGILGTGLGSADVIRKITESQSLTVGQVFSLVGDSFRVTSLASGQVPSPIARIVSATAGLCSGALMITNHYLAKYNLADVRVV